MAVAWCVFVVAPSSSLILALFITSLMSLVGPARCASETRPDDELVSLPHSFAVHNLTITGYRCRVRLDLAEALLPWAEAHWDTAIAALFSWQWCVVSQSRRLAATTERKGAEDASIDQGWMGGWSPYEETSTNADIALTLLGFAFGSEPGASSRNTAAPTCSESSSPAMNPALRRALLRQWLRRGVNVILGRPTVDAGEIFFGGDAASKEEVANRYQRTAENLFFYFQPGSATSTTPEGVPVRCAPANPLTRIPYRVVVPLAGSSGNGNASDECQLLVFRTSNTTGRSEECTARLRRDALIPSFPLTHDASSSVPVAVLLSGFVDIVVVNRPPVLDPVTQWVPIKADLFTSSVSPSSPPVSTPALAALDDEGDELEIDSGLSSGSSSTDEADLFCPLFNATPARVEGYRVTWQRITLATVAAFDPDDRDARQPPATTDGVYVTLDAHSPSSSSPSSSTPDNDNPPSASFDPIWSRRALVTLGVTLPDLPFSNYSDFFRASANLAGEVSFHDEPTLAAGGSAEQASFASLPLALQQVHRRVCGDVSWCDTNDDATDLTAADMPTTVVWSANVAPIRKPVAGNGNGSSHGPLIPVACYFRYRLRACDVVGDCSRSWFTIAILRQVTASDLGSLPGTLPSAASLVSTSPGRFPNSRQPGSQSAAGEGGGVFLSSWGQFERRVDSFCPIDVDGCTAALRWLPWLPFGDEWSRTAAARSTDPTTTTTGAAATTSVPLVPLPPPPPALVDAWDAQCATVSYDCVGAHSPWMCPWVATDKQNGSTVAASGGAQVAAGGPQILLMTGDVCRVASLATNASEGDVAAGAVDVGGQDIHGLQLIRRAAWDIVSGVDTTSFAAYGRGPTAWTSWWQFHGALTNAPVEFRLTPSITHRSRESGTSDRIADANAVVSLSFRQIHVEAAVRSPKGARNPGNPQSDGDERSLCGTSTELKKQQWRAVLVTLPYRKEAFHNDSSVTEKDAPFRRLASYAASLQGWFPFVEGVPSSMKRKRRGLEGTDPRSGPSSTRLTKWAVIGSQPTALSHLSRDVMLAAGSSLDDQGPANETGSSNVEGFIQKFLGFEPSACDVEASPQGRASKLPFPCWPANAAMLHLPWPTGSFKWIGALPLSASSSRLATGEGGTAVALPGHPMWRIVTVPSQSPRRKEGCLAHKRLRRCVVVGDVLDEVDAVWLSFWDGERQADGKTEGDLQDEMRFTVELVFFGSELFRRQRVVSGGAEGVGADETEDSGVHPADDLPSSSSCLVEVSLRFMPAPFGTLPSLRPNLLPLALSLPDPGTNRVPRAVASAWGKEQLSRLARGPTGAAATTDATLPIGRAADVSYDGVVPGSSLLSGIPINLNRAWPRVATNMRAWPRVATNIITLTTSTTNMTPSTSMGPPRNWWFSDSSALTGGGLFLAARNGYSLSPLRRLPSIYDPTPRSGGQSAGGLPGKKSRRMPVISYLPQLRSLRTPLPISPTVASESGSGDQSPVDDDFVTSQPFYQARFALLSMASAEANSTTTNVQVASSDPGVQFHDSLLAAWRSTLSPSSKPATPTTLTNLLGVTLVDVATLNYRCRPLWDQDTGWSTESPVDASVNLDASAWFALSSDYLLENHAAPHARSGETPRLVSDHLQLALVLGQRLPFNVSLSVVASEVLRRDALPIHAVTLPAVGRLEGSRTLASRIWAVQPDEAPSARVVYVAPDGSDRSQLAEAVALAERQGRGSSADQRRVFPQSAVPSILRSPGDMVAFVQCQFSVLTPYGTTSNLVTVDIFLVIPRGIAAEFAAAAGSGDPELRETGDWASRRNRHVIRAFIAALAVVAVGSVSTVMCRRWRQRSRWRGAQRSRRAVTVDGGGVDDPRPNPPPPHEEERQPIRLSNEDDEADVEMTRRPSGSPVPVAAASDGSVAVGVP